MSLFNNTKASKILEPPPFKTTMWDDIAKRYRKRVEADAAKGIESAIKELAALNAPQEERKAKAVKRSTNAGRRNTGSLAGSSRPSYDHAEICRLYVDEKMTVNEIAAKLGCARHTVSSALTKNDIKRDNARSGSQPRTHCPKNHSMDDAIPIKRPDGTVSGRACRKCKAIRGAEAWKKKKAARDARKAVLAGK